MNRHRYSSGDGVLGDEDLLTEILLRLPVKDLLRCKCVCKKWKSFISDPQFCYRHTLILCRKHKHNPYLYPSGIIVRSSHSHDELDMFPFTNNTKIRRFNVKRFDDAGELDSYFIRPCNDGFDHRVGSLSRLYLAFEPWKSPHYKVIVFDKVFGNNREDYELIATKIKNLPTIPLLLKPRSSYYMQVCGRNLHWITFKFDGEWKFDIWELKEDYSGWILRYHVDLLATLRIDLQACSLDAVLGVVHQPPNEDEDEESVLVIIVVDFFKIVSYNLKNRISRIIYEEDGDYHAPGFHGLYFETLISI
ncbi:hypothetical protein PIB30_058817 [Stylosanthes scabra]|uniref:F-box domain-containing protein n=1 Tax=Stylosanthes scabra TaxID=79078 RepID=A0ABU6RKF1_9FABA|nr:hypothetical protein [Stylosanthes scabra]